jgi:RNA polymerase sigma factor (sigma-70 family)
MDTEEFKIRILPLKNKLFRLALRLTRNREESEDVVQEVFLKIWSMRFDLRKYDSVEALMMTMTKNQCLDRLKVKKNKAKSLAFDVREDIDNNPYKLSEQRDMFRTVMRVVDGLPEQQKTVIQLRDVEAYTFDEVAEITGFDQNYIRVNLSRARKKIRETIEKLQQNELQQH